MRTCRTIAPIAVALLLSGGALRADFSGFAVDVLHPAGAPPGTKTIRLSVMFTEPNDQLLFVGSIAGVPFKLETNAPGGFLNDCASPLSCLMQEDFAAAPITAEWDSYVTIGATSFSPNDTIYAPGFADGDGVSLLLGGQSVCDDGMPGSGWLDINPLTPELPDAEGRTLIGQFTIREGDGGGTGVWLTGAIIWQPEPGANMTTLVEFLWEGGPAPGVPCPGEQACACAECAADFDQSGAVAFGDLLALLAAWGPCGACAEDLDGDGAVAFDDLLVLLSAWGVCP